MSTLVVGLLAGASLGPGIFILVAYFEPKGDALLSIAIGALVAFGLSLVLGTFAAYLILPRLFSSARGTLTAVVEALAHASQAHAQGRSDAALAHLGRAAHEGVAWYSVGATRRFVVQAALGLLISFGGIVGSVLLLSQNSLLRDQNTKIDKQIELLAEQNNKIEQQTAIADAQKRSAFVTEMFSILQEAAKELAKPDRKTSELPKDLVTRIAILTISAVPYRYISRAVADKDPETVVLSPERGQLLLALARMNVKLSVLSKAGAVFESADVRGLDLTGIDLSDMTLRHFDFSYSTLTKASFVKSTVLLPVIKETIFVRANFNGAVFTAANFNEARLESANFDNAGFNGVVFRNGSMGGASFEGARYTTFRIQDVLVSRFIPLPKGLPWPENVRKSFEEVPQGGTFLIHHEFNN